MKMEYLNIEGTVGEQIIKNEQLYTMVEPHGLKEAGGDEFRLYLPGRHTSDLSDDFRIWTFPAFDSSDLPEELTYYALEHINGMSYYGKIKE